MSENARAQAFRNKVKKAERVLKARSKASAEQRIKAAQWLGSSGEMEAIPTLVEMYDKEDDPQVKQAIAYALGQFKAIDKATERDPEESVIDGLAREENEWLYDRLVNIALGDGGKRQGSSRVPVIILVVLALSLAGLVAANVITMDSELGEPEPTQLALAPEAEIALNTLNEMEIQLAAIRDPAQTLQDLFTTAGLEQPIDCTVEVATTPEPFTTPPETLATYPQLDNFASRLNGALSGLSVARTIRDQICRLEGRNTTETELERVESSLTTTLDTLDTLEGNIDDLAGRIEAGTGPVDITPEESGAATEAVEGEVNVEEPTVIPTPTIEPTPTRDPETVNVHIRALTSITADMTATRGPVELLEQFWEDVQSSGQTDGCRDSIPDIPEDYDDIPAEVAEAFPNLAQAGNDVNLGLDLLRQGWNLFVSSCQNGTLPAQVETGLTFANTARLTFTSADEQLRDLRER